MNVLITGDVGSGKTTVCEKVVEIAISNGLACGGVICPAIIDEGKKAGSRIVNLKNNESMVFSEVKERADSRGIEVGKYRISEKAMEFGRAALMKAMDSDLVVIDEVGPLELNNEGLMPELARALKSKQDKLVVVRSSLKESFVELYRDMDFHIFELNANNRNRLPEEIFNTLQNENQDIQS